MYLNFCECRRDRCCEFQRTIKPMRSRKKQQKRPTLEHVAAAAGVSKMTVSNVANGHFKLVRQSTVRRVQEAIERLGYRPHLNARALRLSRGWAIGLLLVTRKSDFLASQWMGNVITGLSNYLSDHGYSLLLHTQHPDSLDSSLLLKWANTDGLCVLLSGSDAERSDILSKLSRLKLPVVVLQETISLPHGEDMAIVRQDDFSGGKKLAEHLVSQGARRLAYVKPNFSWPALAERERGIASGIANMARASLRSLECHDDSYEAVAKSVCEEIDRGGLPDAFLAANETIALSILDYIETRGWRMPQDVLLTGFNAFEFAKRKVTTVRFPAGEVGRRAGEQIFARVSNGRFYTKVDVLPGTLLIGDTTFSKRPKRDMATRSKV